MTQNLTEKRVLLVDGDPDSASATRTILEGANFAVTTADSLATAEKALAECRPDLVVASAMLDISDGGFVLAHRVKKRDPRTPVLLLSAIKGKMGFEITSETPEDRAWTKADAMLENPFRDEQLIREATRLCR